MLVVILVLCANTVKKMTLNILKHLLKQCDSIQLGKGYHSNKPGRTADISRQSQPTTKTKLGTGYNIYVCPLHI